MSKKGAISQFIEKYYSKCRVCYILVLIKLIFDKKLHHEQLEVTY